MRKLIAQMYWALERTLTPNLRYSQHHYYEALRQFIPSGCVWLDMGCGHQMFADFMRGQEAELAARARHLVGIDLDFEGMLKNRTITDLVYGDIGRLPFPDATFDVVTANMVTEHLPNPRETLMEVSRVLRPGGWLIFHTPNRLAPIVRIAKLAPDRLKRRVVHLLENRSDEDIFPTFYRINTPDDVRELLSGSNFELECIRCVSTSAATAALGIGALPELLWLRLLDWNTLSRYRSNLIVISRKSKALDRSRAAFSQQH